MYCMYVELNWKRSEVQDDDSVVLNIGKPFITRISRSVAPFPQFHERKENQRETLAIEWV